MILLYTLSYLLQLGILYKPIVLDLHEGGSKKQCLYHLEWSPRGMEVSSFQETPKLMPIYATWLTLKLLILMIKRSFYMLRHPQFQVFNFFVKTFQLLYICLFSDPTRADRIAILFVTLK